MRVAITFMERVTNSCAVYCCGSWVEKACLPYT